MHVLLQSDRERGGGGGRDPRSLRTTALEHPFIQAVEDLIRISVEGPSLEDFEARERVWPAGLAPAKDQES